MIRQKVKEIIDYLLASITAIIVCLLLCLDDFSWKSFPVILVAIGIVILNVVLLKKRGFDLYE